MKKANYLVFLFCYISNCLAQGKPSGKPNIILINMDDMGYGDTEPYGMTGISTPNLTA